MNCFGVVQSANTEFEEKALLTYRIMGTLAANDIQMWPATLILSIPIHRIHIQLYNIKFRGATTLSTSYFHFFPDTYTVVRSKPFSCHYQGSIDFNTVNIHRTVEMYFLVSTGKRDDIECHDLQGSYYLIHSLCPRVYSSIQSLGKVFPHTPPWANIRSTSSCGIFWKPVNFP